MSYLLDTNVVSEARRPAGNTNVKTWLTSVPAESLYLSVIALGEIVRGIERLRRRDQAQAAIYETWLTTLRSGYADRVIPVSAEIAEEWGRLSVPDLVPVADGLIAATALVHRLTLVTRNTADFARTGVRLLNPFER